MDKVLSLDLDSGFPSSLDSGFPSSLDSRFPSSLDSGFPSSLDSGFPSSLDSGFPSSLDSGFPSSLDSGFSSLAGTPEDGAVTGQPSWTTDIDFLGTLVCEPQGLQHRDQDISFFIQQGRSAYLDTSKLVTFVTGPSGTRLNVNITPKDGGFQCLFRPYEMGIHVGSASIGPYHLPGSPFHVVIDRDYARIQKPIITMDAEMIHSSQQLKIRKPWGVTCNTSNEQIFITDRQYHEVVVYAPEGDQLFSFGGWGDGPGLFNRPTGIAYDALHDRVCITDKDNHRIQLFNPQGRFIKLFGRRGKIGGQFFYPWGIAVSTYGLIVVADSRNHRLQLFNSEGQLLRKFQPTQSSQTGFDFPRGVTFDLCGDNIFVSDFNSHAIFKLNLDFTTCVKIIDQDLRRPSGLAVDHAGNLLVADTRNNAVKVFSACGTFLHSIQTLGHVALELPTDVAIMLAGHFAIFDFNGRISIV